MSTYQVSGSRITHNYQNFRGVDFTNKEVSLYRSPDALNIWKNYRTLGKTIETRPEIELVQNADYSVFGLIFLKVNSTEMMITHEGTHLYKTINGTKSEITPTGITMNPRESSMFVYNNILYIIDGTHYLQFDGLICKEVEGYVPTTFIGMSPSGSGTQLQPVNLLTNVVINSFVADGSSTDYQLNSGGEAIDSTYNVEVYVDDVKKTLVTDYTVDYTNAKIIFVTAPEKPLTTGRDNVTVKFRLLSTGATQGYKERIINCTKSIEFDNRIFLTGNPNYPTALFYGNEKDPTYFPSNYFQEEGNDQSPVKDMVIGNNALWVFKKPNQESGVFYHTPTTTLDERGNAYVEYFSTHSSIKTGCVGKAVNFNDDICFFSPRGLEAITSDITTEQMLTHRSSLIDSRLLNEENYENMKLAEWEGYLFVCIDNKVYLADSNQDYSNSGRYEWFYWELSKNVTCTYVHNNVLYIGSEDGIYSFTNFSKDRRLDSYITTTYDEFGYPQYQKITNKRGCVIDGNTKKLKVYYKVDNKDWKLIRDYSDVNGYAVNKIKVKKWKGIQIKLASNYPMDIYSMTLEAYVGGYLKR